MPDRSTEHQIADLRERLARVESDASHHHLSQEHMRQQLHAVAEIARQAVQLALSLRSDVAGLQADKLRPQAGPTEASIKIALAVAVPLLVLLATRDPQQAVGIAKSLLSPGMGAGH